MKSSLRTAAAALLLTATLSSAAHAGESFASIFNATVSGLTAIADKARAEVQTRAQYSKPVADIILRGEAQGKSPKEIFAEIMVLSERAEALEVLEAEYRVGMAYLLAEKQKRYNACVRVNGTFRNGACDK